jgi:ketosteroid isomerase-like protein
VAERGPETTIRAFYDRWNADGPASLSDTATEGIVWHDDPILPGAADHEGREAVAAHMEEFVDMMGHFQIGVRELGELGDGRWYAVLAVSAQGRASGAPVARDHVHAIRVADHRVAEISMYTDAAKARRELGLDDVRG